MKQLTILLGVVLGFLSGLEAASEKDTSKIDQGRWKKVVIQVMVNKQPYQVIGDERGVCIAPVQAKKVENQENN